MFQPYYLVLQSNNNIFNKHNNRNKNESHIAIEKVGLNCSNYIISFDYKNKHSHINETKLYCVSIDDFINGFILSDINKFSCVVVGTICPTEERDDDSYPGSGNTRDTYSVRWFAGITIKSHDVELDIQGQTMVCNY